MNKDRRATAQVCIELMKECASHGEISEASYVALQDAIKVMQQAEYWSLRNQSRHEGKNPSTDEQIAVSKVALPAIDAAIDALAAEDYDTVIEQLTLAVTTDGSVPKTAVKKRLRKVST